MIAYTRLGWDADYMLQDRYRPYALLLAALLYLRSLAAFAALQRTWIAGASIAASLGFAGLSYAQSYPDMVFMKRESEALLMNALLEPPAPVGAKETDRSLIRQALASGLWRPRPDLRSAPDLALLSRASPPAQAVPTPWRCLHFPSRQGYLFEPANSSAEPALPDPATLPARPDFGVIFQNGHPLVVPVTTYRASFRTIPITGRFLSDRYTLLMPATDHRPGPHLLYGFRREEAGRLTLLWHTSIACP
jgi:hypothetical protein